MNLVGTSGGAWVAINAALKRPDLVEKVVADSFDGRTLGDHFAENLLQERKMPGRTKGELVFISGARERLTLFTKPLCELQVPFLLLGLGGAGDEMLRTDFQDEYRAIAAETGAAVTIFSTGSHPAILSNAEQAADVICTFLK